MSAPYNVVDLIFGKRLEHRWRLASRRIERLGWGAKLSSLRNMNGRQVSGIANETANGGSVGDSGPIHLRQEIGPCMYLRSELQISEGI